MKNYIYCHVILVVLSGGLLLLSGCKKEKIDPVLPTVITSPALSVTSTVATIGGDVTTDGGATVTARGVSFGTSQNPTINGDTTNEGMGIGVFTSTLTGLTVSTMYYVRAYATNSVGTAYGNEVSFSTSSSSTALATVTTTSVSSVTSTGASTGGNVTSDGGAPVMARGVAYGTSQSPTTSNITTSNGTGTGVFTSTLTGLTVSTLYYIRAYATNNVGTAYGNEVSFTTGGRPPCLGTPSVTDIDGNTYNTVQIGNQCWTQSNLKVSKYRNGNNIATGLSDAQWSSTTEGAYAVYNNVAANDALYGKLYNWYAIYDSRDLCPLGWHVPSDAEWTTLTTFLGGESVAGGAMKSTATQPTPGGWLSPNTDATNSSGFTGLPGGNRFSGGGFFDLGSNGYLWSSSAAGLGYAFSRSLYSFNAIANRDRYDLRVGFSVRCVRN